MVRDPEEGLFLCIGSFPFDLYLHENVPDVESKLSVVRDFNLISLVLITLRSVNGLYLSLVLISFYIGSVKGGYHCRTY